MDTESLEMTTRDSNLPASAASASQSFTQPGVIEHDGANSQHPVSLPPVDGGFSAWSFVSVSSNRAPDSNFHVHAYFLASRRISHRGLDLGLPKYLRYFACNVSERSSVLVPEACQHPPPTGGNLVYRNNVLFW